MAHYESDEFIHIRQRVIDKFTIIFWKRVYMHF